MKRDIQRQPKGSYYYFIKTPSALNYLEEAKRQKMNGCIQTTPALRAAIITSIGKKLLLTSG